MDQTTMYRYQPTPNGIKYTSTDIYDPVRRVPCVLYPDNRRELIFSESELAKIAKNPFRPVALAMLSPRYELDMHCAAGMVGYGRFAAVKNGTAVWLDEFAHIETEYYNGEMRYCIQDNRISDQPMHLVLIAGRGACGLVIRLDTSAWGQDIDLYYLHGGMLGWHTHSPFRLPYQCDMCWGNAITVSGDTARIYYDEQEPPVNPYYLNRIKADEGRMSVNRLWKILDGWKQQILIRAENASMLIAPPDALNTLVTGHLRTASEAWGELVCAKLPAGTVCYTAVGLGDAMRSRSLADVFADMQQSNHEIAARLIVKTGNTAFDGAVTAAAFPTDGVFGDNVYLHGNLSWREGYIGWRVGYGPLAYGMTDVSAAHFENHFATTLITEGPDQGAFCATSEEARHDAIAFYNMHQTFLHQARRHWEYTGDRAFAEKLLPIVEGCIERDKRRLKPGSEMLFENCLNTWISDHHWTIMGQCTQASAYLYNLHMLASELTDDPEKKTYYAGQAEAIKCDMNRVLWQERKGVFAYAKDLRGYQMLHTEPELGDVYHPTELGVTDMLQTYQMLDWAEANLDWEVTDNGGHLCRSSNWHPNGGHKYSHSIYELNGGDQLNLALAYQEIGLTEPAYRIFKSFYHALYGGRDPGVYNFDYAVGRLQGVPQLYIDTALNLPCHLSTNGVARLNPLFGDTIGMYGREIYEGILGVRPKLQNREIWLTPCIPDEMPHLDMQSALLDYRYDRDDAHVRLQYKVKQSGSALRVKIQLPVASIDRVSLNGTETAYTLVPGFCGVSAVIAAGSAEEGVIEIAYTPTASIPIEPRRVLSLGEHIALAYTGEKILELQDPQHLLSDTVIENGHLDACVTGAEGSGVFFLKMRAADTEYIRPVKVRIGEKKKPEVFRNFRDEFSAPYHWEPVNMENLFNHTSPGEAARRIIATATRPPEEYSQVNFNYYTWHVSDGFIANTPLYRQEPERWRSLIDENGIAVTGEGIPFRSVKDGNCLAAATLVSPEYADRVLVPVDKCGRAVYLLITGITLPMQSHVENLRIIIRYEDGITEEHPLYNPEGIGDMWFTKFERYHDTPANGFENIGTGRGALSSAGLDLTKPIATDLEAHILRFHLRRDVCVREIEMRIIANDVIFGLMGVTLLQ